MPNVIRTTIWVTLDEINKHSPRRINGRRLYRENKNLNGAMLNPGEYRWKGITVEIFLQDGDDGTWVTRLENKNKKLLLWR